MSKIIRDSINFIPETLIPAGNAPPVWGDIAAKIEVNEPTSSEREKNRKKKSSDSVSSDQQAPGEQHDSFDADFSSPLNAEESPQSDSGPHSNTNNVETFDKEAFAEEVFNKGIQAGIERMESDYGASIKTLQSVCEQLNEIRHTILKNSMDEMVELVLKISEKIIRQSVSSQHETIIRTVEEAIQQAVKSDEFIISVNPADLEIVKQKSPDFIASIGGLENIVVRADPKIEQGGCLVESTNCTVDATLISQLDILADTIKK